MSGSKGRARLVGLRAGLILIVACVVFFSAAAAATVNVQSIAYGDKINVNTDYGMVNITPGCAYSVTGYTARMASGPGSFENALGADANTINQQTAASVTGMYKDSLITSGYNAGEGCENQQACCGKDTGAYGGSASFSTKATGGLIRIQTAGNSTTASLNGQAYITGDGKATLTGSSISETFTTQQTFKQRITTDGKHITAGMTFGWMR